MTWENFVAQTLKNLAMAKFVNFWIIKKILNKKLGSKFDGDRKSFRQGNMSLQCLF
jgi:hypothetical protein